MSEYFKVLDEFDIYEDYYSDTLNLIDNNFYQKLKEDTIFHKFPNINVNNIEKKSILDIRDLLRKLTILIQEFQNHSQYHPEHKINLAKKIYNLGEGEWVYMDYRLKKNDETGLYINLKDMLLEEESELKRRNDLNILDLYDRPYTYKELEYIHKDSYKTKENTREVESKHYYDFLNPKGNSKLLYLHYINMNNAIKIFSVSEYYFSYPGFSINYVFANFKQDIINTHNPAYIDRLKNQSYYNALLESIEVAEKTFYNYQYTFNKKGTAIFIKNGKYGLIDKNNKIIVNPSFDYISNTDDFEEYNCTEYKIGKIRGLISFEGKRLFETEKYNHFVMKDADLLYLNYENKEIALMNFKTGQILIEGQYGKLEFEQIKKNLLRIKIGMKTCLMNYDGGKIIDFTNVINYALKERKYFKENNIKNI